MCDNGFEFGLANGLTLFPGVLHLTGPWRKNKPQSQKTIHHSIRGGWVWNLWGRDSDIVRLKNGGILWIGTDDASDLARFVEATIM